MTTQQTFTCAKCGDVFVSERPEEEAIAERQAQFGDWDWPDAVICDDCYKAFIGDKDAIRH